MSGKIRLREALNDSTFRRKLVTAIPKECLVPLDAPAKYPTAFLKTMDNDYSSFGVLTEILLRSPVDINAETFQKCISIPLDKKMLALKSTTDYFQNVNKTRNIVSSLLNSSPMYEVEISSSSTTIVGHPDIFTPSQIFEVKTSGKIKMEWTGWIVQLFAYAALNKLAGGTTERVHLVLPLSSTVWSYDISNLKEKWPKFENFVKVLCEFQPVFRTPFQLDMMESMFTEFPRLGFHIPKEKTMTETVTKMIGSQRVAQFFMTMNTRLAIEENDIASTRKIVDSNKLHAYVHAPYLLNLCKTDEYISTCIRKLLVAGEKCGFRGVVFHVGKSCDVPLDEALKNARELISVATAITPDYQGKCKFLLETPAGQGTETLTDPVEFSSFVKNLHSDAVGICVDTCHVFACGHDPVNYISTLLNDAETRNKFSLVHFNDSACDFGSRKDRHARIGCGKISHDSLKKCAEIIEMYNLDAVHE